MTETLQVQAQEITPKTMTREEWSAFHEYRRIRHDEIRPEDPVTPDDVRETEMKQDDPDNIARRFVVFQDGKIVSALNAGVKRPDSASYESNKHLFWADATVLRPFRRQGIGTMWLGKVAELMREYDTSVLTTGTEEEDGHAFCKWFGAEEKFSGAENRLDFRTIDWAKIEGWASEGRKKSPDSDLLLYEHRVPEDVMQDYCPVISEVAMTMPFEDLDHGDIVLTPELLSQWYKQMDETGDSHHSYMTREPDGAISSMTDVFWSPHTPTMVHQGFTGVKTEYRGRGLGKWVKAAMLLYLRGKIEDIHWIVTDNAGTNKWMLDINEELGFKQYKPQSSYQIGIEGIKTHLSKL
ncbi:MAG: GNAT family N-acetyltransferase [Actinomycetota bacterium]